MKAGRLFEPWLGQLTGRSPNPLVKSSKMNIRRLLELDTVVPQKYVWKYITTNAFNEEQRVSGEEARRHRAADVQAQILEQHPQVRVQVEGRGCVLRHRGSNACIILFLPLFWISTNPFSFILCTVYGREREKLSVLQISILAG